MLYSPLLFFFTPSSVVCIIKNSLWLLLLWPLSVVAVNVGGILNSDTTWVPSDSPYVLTSQLQIAHGVTLTILPGVVVSNGTITVFGRISATGNTASNVLFKSVIVAAGINDPAVPYSMAFRFCNIRGGMVVPNNYGAFLLEDSIVEMSQWIYVWYPVFDVSIQRNVFSRSGGISVGCSGAVTVTIANNIFYQWYSSNGEGEYAVQNWTLYNGAKMIVTSNAFLNTDRVAIRLQGGNSGMIATNNFWSTIAVSVINGMIFDRNDDLGVPTTIPFSPFLTSLPEWLPAVPRPVILSNPASRVVNAGEMTVFSIVAKGVGDLSYQWTFNGNDISGETNSSLTLTSVSPSHSGNYVARVSNFMGASTNSGLANLIVSLVPPIIQSQPANQTVVAGSNITFSITVSGTPPLTYQWLRNGSAVMSATNETFTISGVQTNDAGTYSVVVFNAASFVVSKRHRWCLLTEDHQRGRRCRSRRTTTSMMPWLVQWFGGLWPRLRG